MDTAARPEFAHAEAVCDSIPCHVIRRDRCGVPEADVLAPQEQAGALWRKLEQAVRDQGGRPVGLDALNAIRLEHALPWFGLDYDEKQIPHEAAIEQSHINYEKGCYTGQEIVERVRSRGHVNRRLALLEFFTAAPPEPETKVYTSNAACETPAVVPGEAAENEAGQVTSTAFSPQLGHPIGFAYLRRENSLVGTRLNVPGGDAQVIPAPAAT